MASSERFGLRLLMKENNNDGWMGTIVGLGMNVFNACTKDRHKIA